MNEEAPTVFVVDDDASVRRALQRLMASVKLRVETFASAREFLGCQPARGPACLVLDVRMPGLSGLDLQHELSRADQALPIIFITGHGDIPMSVRAMKAGAVDFLQKPFNDRELFDAVYQALARNRRARREQAELAEIQRRLGTLTRREYEVLTWVITGMLNKQIAAALGVAEKTITVHRARVMQKLHIVSVAALVRLAEKAGIPPASG